MENTLDKLKLKFTALDFSATVYRNTNTNITVVCKVHGSFTARPCRMLTTECGCTKCNEESRTARRLHKLKASIISKHKTAYTYPFLEEELKTLYSKITIVCKIHGTFTQTVEDHLTSVTGCPKCSIIKAAKQKESNLTSFITKANKIHNHKYDYSKSIYKSAKEKITITCPYHGDFEQLVSGHLSGYGCSHCASHGKGRVDMNKPCTLYYLHIKNTTLYKIGITSLSIEHRYRTAFDKEQFDVVFTKHYQTGREAYTIEQSLLKQFASSSYTGGKILKTGNTELFTEDIFKGNYLDYTT